MTKALKISQHAKSSWRLGHTQSNWAKNKQWILKKKPQLRFGQSTGERVIKPQVLSNQYHIPKA